MARRQVENVLWLCTTPDALELPVAVAGSVKELAQMLDVSVETIYSSIWQAAKRGGKCIYRRVVLDKTEMNGGMIDDRKAASD